MDLGNSESSIRGRIRKVESLLSDMFSCTRQRFIIVCLVTLLCPTSSFVVFEGFAKLNALILGCVIFLAVSFTEKILVHGQTRVWPLNESDQQSFKLTISISSLACALMMPSNMAMFLMNFCISFSLSLVLLGTLPARVYWRHFVELRPIEVSLPRIQGASCGNPVQNWYSISLRRSDTESDKSSVHDSSVDEEADDPLQNSSMEDIPQVENDPQNPPEADNSPKNSSMEDIPQVENGPQEPPEADNPLKNTSMEDIPQVENGPQDPPEVDNPLKNSSMEDIPQVENGPQEPPEAMSEVPSPPFSASQGQEGKVFGIFPPPIVSAN